MPDIAALNTPSHDTLRAVAREALLRTAISRGQPSDSITPDAISGLTELMIVAARIEAKAAARARYGVDSAA